MGRRPAKSQKRTESDHRPPLNAVGPTSDSAKGSVWMTLAVCGFLLVAVWLVFGRTIHYDFVNYDDNEYVTDNLHIQQGSAAQKLRWAFTARDAANWHPLTWLSHMLDYRLYGLHAGGHHLTNVLLHAATAVLLFLTLRRMTGALWPSAFVAALFAVHPLRVESVAWVAERKDVLCGLFFVLTLLAYLGYVRRPSSRGRYFAVVALFALGLMSKPMLVTLPFVLLLLDYWPLGRFSGNPGVLRRLVVEKTPLFVLMIFSCILTSMAQAQGEAIVPLDVMPVSARIANASVTYVVYVWRLFWPADLAVFYPRHPLPLWMPAASLAALGSVSIAAWFWRKRFPYAFVGWFWYLGMLVPVIGLVQVGDQTMADRYTYLPQIGLGIAVAWGAAEIARARHWRPWALGAASAVSIAALMGCAYHQTSFWRDSESLWTRALACTSRNAVAHCNLGAILIDRGQTEAAIENFELAVTLHPADAGNCNNYGAALQKLGRHKEAIAQFRAALKYGMGGPEPHAALAQSLMHCGRNEEAIAEFQKALKIQPDFVQAHSFLADIFAGQRRMDEAIAQLEEVVKIKPDYAEAHSNLGLALTGRGRMDDAVRHYRKAIELKPDYAEAYSNWGIALAKQGRIDEALTQFRTALVLAERHNNPSLAAAIRERIRRVEAGVHR